MSLRKQLPLLVLCLSGFFLAMPAAGQSTAPEKQEKSPGAQAPAPKPDSAEQAGSSDVYRIGVGDQLAIAVWHERDLTLTVVVRPDGIITMPLLNDIYVVGQTPKELGASLTEKLKPFVNEPQVTISVVSIQSRKVYVIGQVTRQGSFPLNDKKTVLELITEAGGLGPFAKANSIYVLRVVNGKEVKIPFQYKKVIAGRGQDVELQPGDRLIVP